MIIFVCSPLRASQDRTLEDNLKAAHGYCQAILNLGHFPLAPHVILTHYLDDTDPKQRRLGQDLAKQLLEVCDELWVCGPHVSSGMFEEIQLALSLGVPIRHEFSNLDEILDSKFAEGLDAYLEALSQLTGVRSCPQQPQP